MKTTLVTHIAKQLHELQRKKINVSGYRQVFGGDINKTYVLNCNDEYYFIKVNTADFTDLYKREIEGLLLLSSANGLKIPRPLLQGKYEAESYLVLEYLETGSESKTLWQRLATGLARQHKISWASFGLPYNNYIGTVLQSNTPADAWTDFYADQRIMPLIHDAYQQQKCTKNDVHLAEQLCNKLSVLMPEETPSLLHGDLWGGNKLFTVQGDAAVFDPAVYYGHRETDIAMTSLFGGFDPVFYATYNDIFPLQHGWHQRADMFQLYPLLVHLLLFGGRYYPLVHNILKKYA